MASPDVKSPRDPAEVRAEIERAREQISASVEEIKREVAARTDWREWVRRRPYVFVGAALALGFVLGSRR